MGSVTIDHHKLDSAITKVSTLSSAVDRHRNNVLFKSPVDHPKLSALSSVPTWLDGEKPMLQGLRDIAYLLATESNPVVTFDVGNSLHDVEELLGKTLADSALNTSPYDEESARKFEEILGRWSDDPQVMSDMFGTLGPENTLRVMSTWATPLADRPRTDGPTDQQENILRQMKYGLQSATKEGGWTDYEAEQFGSGLVDAATIPVEDYYGRGNYNPSGALAYLLHEGRYSDAFIGQVAEDLDQYERQDNNHAGGDIWNSRPTQGVEFGDFMPYGTYNPYEGGNLDPVTAMMSALGNSPEASLEFFGDNDDDGKEGGQLSRAYYYIHERTYPHDAYAGLTSALDAATTDSSILQDGSEAQKKSAALLASKTVEYFSEIDGDAEDDLKRELSRFPENGASENLAHILSTYMPAVEEGIKYQDDIDPSITSLRFESFGGNIENMPVFDAAGLKDFMQLSTATDAGLAEVTHGMNQWRGQNLGTLADQIADGNADGSAIREGYQNDARLQGFLIKAMGDENISEGRSKDERIAATIDMFSDVVDLVPVPGANKIAEGVGQTVFNYVVDEGKGAGFDALKEHYATNEERQVDHYNDLAGETEARGQYSIAHILASRGLLADEDALSDVTYSNGDIPTYSEYLRLSDGDKFTVRSELFSSDAGVGRHFSEQDYREAFQSIINEKYFEKGDG